jgi:predicted phage terminase large subunit-like protein
MKAIRPNELAAILRQDLSSFIGRSFLELNPQAELLMNWHIELIAAELELCRLGKCRRLIINVPPRHLKSHCASIAFPAWLLGHDPSAQAISVTYGQELSDKLARDCRTLMASKWYQSLFPTRLASTRQAVQEFVTTKQGFRLATSVGGVLTGRGADFIVIDDPLKPDEALSESQRRAVNDWYDHTLYSRLNDKAKGCIIIIMQRLHEDDLVGHVLQQEGWRVVGLPAIAEQEERHTIASPLGIYHVTRHVGDILHPERESAETLEQIRRTNGEYHFSGQYQQAPAPLGGGMVKQDWFKSYAPNELPEKFDRIIQSWDTANKPSELSDYSACTTWGLKGPRFYLLNVLRRRMAYPDLKRAVRELWEAYGPTVVLIEDKASGTQLIQELVEDGIRAVKRFKPEYDKVMRLHAQTATIENGFVYLPQEGHWLAEYVREMTTFPNGKYDDQVDSTSQALEWVKQRRPGQGFLDYMREMDEQRASIDDNSISVKMIAPRNSTYVQTVTGLSISIPEDGIIYVRSADVESSSALGYRLVRNDTDMERK